MVEGPRLALIRIDRNLSPRSGHPGERMKKMQIDISKIFVFNSCMSVKTEECIAIKFHNL